MWLERVNDQHCIHEYVADMQGPSRWSWWLVKQVGESGYSSSGNRTRSPETTKLKAGRKALGWKITSGGRVSLSISDD